MTPSKCAPLISGPLWVFPREQFGWDEDFWLAELDAQKEIGFDLFWLCGGAGIMNRTDARVPGGDLVEWVMTQADIRGLDVIVSVPAAGVWYKTWDLAAQEAAVAAFAPGFAEKYGRHESFKYWYIPHEVYLRWDESRQWMHRLFTSLTRISKEAKNVPMTISPFFILDDQQRMGPFRYGEPAEYYDFWREVLPGTGVDILMLQDSGEHVSFYTMDDRRPFIDAVCRACRDSGVTFWGNVETGELEVSGWAEYMEKFACHVNDPRTRPYWRAVPIDRLAAKLALAAEYAERIVTWGYREFMRRAAGEKAKKAYDDYKAYYEKITGGVT